MAVWRRRVVAAVATEVAASLRRQIHRQMYRLGQSSLPTEGVGPVINLWTREVNDVRDGVIADLDAHAADSCPGGRPACHRAFGLARPDDLPGVAGLLVWLIARVLTGTPGRRPRAALRDASVQLCLLHEDLGLLRTVRVYGVGEYDRQRFDEHLERYQQADTRRIVTSAPINPSTGLLYGAGAGDRAGAAGLQRRRQRSDLDRDDADPAGLAGGAGVSDRRMAAAGEGDPPGQSLGPRASSSSSSGGPSFIRTWAPHFLNALKEQITFENVELESRSGRRLLEGVSVEIPAGSRTAIMGQDDDAKLALVCLIPRLIDPGRAGS